MTACAWWRSTVPRCQTISSRCWSRRTSRTANGCPTCSPSGSAIPSGSCCPRATPRSAARSRSRSTSRRRSSPKTLIEAEITALELEFDTGGTFTVIRGYDPAHRLFRDRRTVSYVQMTASDIATQVAKRAGLKVGKVDSTSTVFPFVSQAGQTDWEILTQLARDAGADLTVRNGSFSFVHAADVRRIPAGTEVRRGTGPVPLHPHLRTAGGQGRGARLERRGEDGTGRHSPPAKTSTVELPTVKPTDMASAFGNPTYVSTDVPYRTQNEVDQAAKALADEKASAFAEFEGVARGNPELRAGRQGQPGRSRRAVRGKVHDHQRQHRFDPTTGYTTAITVTGKQDRSLLGLASGGSRSRQTPAGVVIAQVTDVTRPGQAWAESRSSIRGFPTDYVSGWARVVCQGGGQGPRLDRASRGRRRGAGRLRAARLRSTGRVRRALQRHRHDADRSERPGRRRLRGDQPSIAGLGRDTGSTCWTRTAAKRASGLPPRTRSS